MEVLIPVGESKTNVFIVEDKDSACNLGSGGLNVFGTPALVAKMEQTSLELVRNYLNEGTDTVGIYIEIKHLKATAIGKSVKITSEITAVDGRKISFAITANDEKGDIIGDAKHERFIVNIEKFMSKLD